MNNVIDFCKNCPEKLNYPDCDLNFPCPYADDDDGELRCQICGFLIVNCICDEVLNEN